MSEAIVLHDQTQAHLERFLLHPTHALLLSGVAGSGKTFTAQYFAAQLLGVETKALANYPYFSLIAPVKNTISIDAIRELQRFTQLKTIGAQPIRRVAIIEYAHTMSTEAQNALLKLLEEPPEDTVLILTVHNSRSLLATIRSRLQIITVLAPEPTKLKTHFEAHAASPQAYAQTVFLSGGLPGLLHALLANDAEHPLVAAIQQAKSLLQADTFERLTQVDSLAKQKETAAAVADALTRIAQAGIDQAAIKNASKQIKQWHQILKAAHAASLELQANVNTKLVLANLMLHM